MKTLLNILVAVALVLGLGGTADAQQYSVQVPGGEVRIVAVEDGAPGAQALEAAAQRGDVGIQAVELHQVRTYWRTAPTSVWIDIRNKGSTPTSSSGFWYNFTINGWLSTPWYKQNNPINPGATVRFYCYTDGSFALQSCEMNGDIYYIWPDDITPP